MIRRYLIRRLIDSREIGWMADRVRKETLEEVLEVVKSYEGHELKICGDDECELINEISGDIRYMIDNPEDEEDATDNH